MVVHYIDGQLILEETQSEQFSLELLVEVQDVPISISLESIHEFNITLTGSKRKFKKEIAKKNISTVINDPNITKKHWMDGKNPYKTMNMEIISDIE